MAFGLEARRRVVIVGASWLFALLTWSLLPVLAWRLLTLLTRRLLGLLGLLLFGCRLFLLAARPTAAFAATGRRFVAL